MLVMLAFIFFGCGQSGVSSTNTTSQAEAPKEKIEEKITVQVEEIAPAVEENLNAVEEKMAEKKAEPKKEKREEKKATSKKKKKKKSSRNPIIKWTETTHAFGTVTEGEQVNHQFFFENTGTEPLFITDATATCGCTVPSYPKVPIRPGESSYIRIAFNTKAKSGAQKPVVTIYTNARKTPFKLYMEGEVTPAADGGGEE